MVSAGDHWSFKMSKQIAPVCELMFGCQTFVRNFIFGGSKGTAEDYERAREQALETLKTTPDESAVRLMLASLQDRIISKVGGASAQLAEQVNAIKRDLPKRTTREDVLRMLAKGAIPCGF